MSAAVEAAGAGAEFSAERLSRALDCTGPVAEELVSLLASPGMPLTGTRKVGLAIASALHRQAGIALPAAVEIVRGGRKLCESVLSTLDFFPPADSYEGRTEHDPFMFFAAHASEAMTVPAIDHFLDVTDGRRVFWRRSTRDPYLVVCELHRLSEAVKGANDPASREQYLDFLSRLQDRVPQFSEWIGTIVAGVFTPAPDRFFEPFPAMRQKIAAEGHPSGSANANSTCVSVNVSLAARCFKRRMLGLQVTDPLAGRSRARQNNHGAPIRI